MEYNRPSLIEGSSKYYIMHSLSKSREFKDKYINIFVNIFLFLGFILCVAGLLIYKYKGKLSKKEKEVKARKEKLYLFQKLQTYALNKQKNSQQLITDLPIF